MLPKPTHNWVVVLQYRGIGKGSISLRPYRYVSILDPYILSHFTRPHVTCCSPPPPSVSCLRILSLYPFSINAPILPQIQCLCARDLPFPRHPSGSAWCRCLEIGKPLCQYRGAGIEVFLDLNKSTLHWRSVYQDAPQQFPSQLCTHMGVLRSLALWRRLEVHVACCTWK